MRRFVLALCLAFVAALASRPANAAGHLDEVVATYSAASAGWLGPSVDLGKKLFFMFVALEVLMTLYAAGFAFLSGRSQPGALAATAMRKLIVYMVALVSLQSFPLFVPQILAMFQTAGGTLAGLTGLSPSAMLDWGVLLASQVLGLGAQAGLLGLPTFLVSLICALVLLGAFLFIALRLTAVLVEGGILVSLLACFIGFASNRFTIQLTENYVVSVIRLGVKTFLLYAMIAVGNQLIPIWSLELNTYSAQLAGYATLFRITGEVVVFAILTSKLPERLAHELTSPSSFLHLRQGLVGNE